MRQRKSRPLMANDTPRKNTALVPTTRFASANVLRADALRHHDGRGHRKTEHHAEQQEHHDIRIADGGEGRLAQKLAHPDGVHRAIDRLQHVAEQNGQRKRHSARGIDPSVNENGLHRRSIIDANERIP
jgi:hypothetical protein